MTETQRLTIDEEVDIRVYGYIVGSPDDPAMLTGCPRCGALGWLYPCSECSYPGRPGFAYRDANGRYLIGPCADLECSYRSLPGGADHDGPHSWQDGTTGWAHDYGQPCSCPDCGGA